MKIKKLIENLPITIKRGAKDVEVSSLASHSKCVAPGALFIAKRGYAVDGANYVMEAIHNGAVAVLSDFYDPSLKEVVQLYTSDVLDVEGRLAAAFYAAPATKLFMVGITGTNGKTTTAYLLRHLVDALGGVAGMIGTIEYVIGEYHFEAELTTPDVITNHKLLGEMVKHGCDTAIMEVSSHGLQQRRVDAIPFNAALFTNLSQDHLDYHGSFEEYGRVKRRLFDRLTEDDLAIINLEDPWGTKMLKRCSARSLSYGFSHNADVYAHEIDCRIDGTTFQVTYERQTVQFESPLIGTFNVLNVLAAVTLLCSRGVPLQALPTPLSQFVPVQGRLERVDNDLGIHVFVDFAHTPDALRNMLETVQSMSKEGRVITIFGAGGNRDRSKRDAMGAVVEQYSDLAIITSDNPRNEDPLLIAQEIAAGFSGHDFMIEIDRKQAIERGVKMAEPGDIVVIAGKGHENYQIFAHQTVPFDDRHIAYEILNEVRCT